MKIAIGDIVDRYTICKLKFERGKIDCSKEINDLLTEIRKYENLESFINKLYNLHGKIWDLESDIRKGNEGILGLEEVGRRAIELRNLNNIRVGIKNKINSTYHEGYIEVKIDHGAEKEPSLIISLTTVPERLSNPSIEGTMSTIKSLCEQEDSDYEVHFNIPEVYNITNTKYVIPEWLEDYKLMYPHLKIFRTEDLGPPTKFVPTLTRVRNPETILLVVDDDLVYYPDMISEHRKYQDLLKDCVICYEGRGPIIPIHNNDIRDSWVLCVTEIREVTSLQHYKSASYKKKLFTQDFYDYYFGKTLSDDILISRFFYDNNIKLFVVPYEKHNHLFETRKLWDKNHGVTSFPVLRYASQIGNTGCNHPGLLKLPTGGRFYEPPNMGKASQMKSLSNVPDVPKFDTDKYTHGYIDIYMNYFVKMKDALNILEIGVNTGGSLQLWANIFSGATIYGIDINDPIDLKNNRIKTFKYSQENRSDLESFINEINREFDVIIDDAGHMMNQQQISFGALFRNVKPGGIYIIEDLHTSNLENYVTSNDSITTLNMLNEYIKNKKIISNHMLLSEIEYLEQNIDSVFIWTSTPDYKQSVTSIIQKK